ncbi:MAG: hypothetical protein ACPG5P_04560 [Saprospiraceae bacterium]
MKTAINIGLAILSIFLIYVLISGIQGPIKFKEEYDVRRKAVIAKLEQNRDAQLAFRSLTKHYAPNYDTLKQVIMADSFVIETVFGDVDAGEEVKIVTTMISAKDSIVDGMGINLDSLMYVPYGNGAKFELQADTTTYQSSNIPVVRCMTDFKTFMPEFSGVGLSDEDAKAMVLKYQRNYPKFDPEKSIGFGDMFKPSTAGNWEN